MKKYFFFAVALALSACTSDEYMGGVNPGEADGAIKFAPNGAAMSRADHTGADAARLLNKKFIVAGFKGVKSADGVVTTSVFDHYIVNWEQNTAGTTESNTADWEYVGVAAAAPAKVTGNQTIKYWDYGTSQYDFIAFSYGNATLKTSGDPTTGEVLVTPVSATNAKTAAYTIKGASADLAKCYIADLVTAYNPEVSSKPVYGNEVQLKFRNLAAKARVALYETIPGYSVKDVHFYQDGTTVDAVNTTITETSATLFATGSAATDNFYTAGTATVYFPTVGTSNVAASDYNKAHVTIASPTSSKKQAFGALDYKWSDDNRLGTADENKLYLGTASNTASYAKSSDPNNYTTILPNETGTTLTLRVNYTLVSNDGSGETINVYGATAVVPSQYCQWKSNYAYTYIFKISDNTNGLTGLGVDKVGLYPITFDAVTVDPTDGSQETVTTVATPSITTYSPGVQPTANNEYLTGEDIYVMVSDRTQQGSVVNDLTTNGKLMVVTQETGAADISEATVLDALNMGATVGDVTTGRNGIKLTRVYPEGTVTSIPGVNGNAITQVTVNGTPTAIAASNVTKFTTGATGTVYAYVYFFESGTPSTYNSAIVPDNEESVDGLYEDFECTQAATGTANGTTVYYQKLTNNNNKYAIKVIRVKE